MRRWLIAILVLLVLIAAGGWAAVYFVLRSDVPRQQVLAILRSETGLRVDAEQLTTTWSGDTRIHELTLTLPTADEPLAVIPDMRVRHSNLLRTVLLGVTIDEVVIENATFVLRQRSDGTWNVQDLIALLTRDEAEEPTDLPDVTVRESTLRIASADGEIVTVEPVEVELDSTGSAAAVTASLPPFGEISGRFTTLGDQRHRFKVVGRGVHELIQHLADGSQPPSPVGFNVTWNGRVEGEALVGRLELHEFAAGPYSAAGRLDLTTQGATITAQPDGLRLRAAEQGLDIRIAAGTVTATPEQVRADDLLAQLGDHKARITGQWELSTQTGSLTATWSGAAETMSLSHTGTLEAALTEPAPDHRQLDLTWRSTGQSEPGNWQFTGEGLARGPSLTQVDWQLTLPQVRWEPAEGEPITVEQVQAVGRIDDGVVKLQRVDAPSTAGGKVTGSGVYDLNQQNWELNLSATDFQVPQASHPPLQFVLGAEGDLERIEVTQFRAEAADAGIAGEATYVFRRTQPLEANVTATFPLSEQRAEAEEAAVSNLPKLAKSADQATEQTDGKEVAPPLKPELPLFRALFTWQGRVAGSLSPLNLQAAGEAGARRVVINGQSLEAAKTQVTAEIKQDRLSAISQPFDMLGGRVQVATDYRLGDQAGLFEFAIEDGSLDQILTIVRPGDTEAQASGQLDADLNVRLYPEREHPVQVSGTWRLDKFASGPLVVDKASGRLQTVGSWLQLEDVKMSADGGTGTATALYDLASGNQVEAQMHLADWPVPLDDYDVFAQVTGDARVQGDPSKQAFTGTMDVAADVRIGNEHAGEVRLKGELLSNSLQLQQVTTNLLSGTVSGNATIRFDDWTTSSGKLTWTGIEPARLSRWAPVAAEIQGALDGSLVFGPAEEPRAPEPLSYTLSLEPSGVTARGLVLGRSQFNGYAGPTRFLLDDSSISLAGGVVRLWLSANRHDERWFTHLQGDFSNLDLDLLNRAFVEESEDMPGRLAGKISIVGPIDNLEAMVGRGTIRIRESDLIGSDIIGAVFRAAGVSDSRRAPTGEGSTRFRFESGDLVIDQFHYDNRGLEVYLNGRVEDIYLGEAAPIDIYVVGSLRPLKDLDLPGFSEFDRLLQGLQSALTTIHATGTLGKPKTQVANVSDLSRSFLRALFNSQQPE